MWFSHLPTSASEWVVRANSGPLSWRDRRAFARWLAEDPRRPQEIEEARATWRAAGALATSQVAHEYLADSLRTVAPSSKSGPVLIAPRIALPFGLAVAACTALIVMLVPDGGRQGQRLAEDADVSTNVGQIERYLLPDESSVTIGAKAVVHVAFVDGAREMELDQGEAFFEVMHENDRPFVVNAGSHEVLVTGTKFNVDYNSSEDSLEVAVSEGSVNVTVPRGENSGAVVRVKAGEVMLFPAAGPPARRNLTPAQASAWRSRMLYFDDARLSDVVTEVNRYARKPLNLSSEDLARLRLTGQFRTDDTRELRFVLQELFGIEARDSAGQWDLYKTATR